MPGSATSGPYWGKLDPLRAAPATSLEVAGKDTRLAPFTFTGSLGVGYAGRMAHSSGTPQAYLLFASEMQDLAGHWSLVTPGILASVAGANLLTLLGLS